MSIIPTRVRVVAFVGIALTCRALLAFSGQGTRPVHPPRTPSIEDTLSELNTHFTVRGRPVHPGLIEKFDRWESDALRPVVIGVDALAAVGSNEYSDGSVTTDKGYVTLNREPGEGYFSYRWLGTVTPGVHVVKSFNNGGGTGVFERLFILSASAGVGQTDGAYHQLLLSVVQVFILGDRDESVVTVRPHSVTIAPSPYRDKPVILRFK